ncbi:hypothetical protein SAMN05518672_10452 [Chitinophaga sp. CF118]|uniref:hypothetical protein n=1 Tax=Chitinophaga sp. CF118 TaxID=1884367 RepID=UPI0008E439A5|nr:hypothetical protein [Chitinophaga sp. CF118]SFD98814.1 hypothetical protein SAMN05518672_10452 [Chitinophaga sp. CF118]
MKKILFFLLIYWNIHNSVFAQNIVDPANLSVPQSSAFKLMDVSPELIETPGTPKAFGLGILQSFNSSSLWPQNYAATFSPYWWVRSPKRNFYNFTGIDENEVNGKRKYHPFNDIKFADISVAFLQKNVIPDSANSNAKVFSVGFRTTILKIHEKNYATELGDLTDAWHSDALKNIDAVVKGNLQFREAVFNGDTTTQRMIRKRINDSLNLITSKENAADLVDEKLLQKPILQWDMAGAYATYGIGDTSWQTGRAGVWTTVALNIPLSKKNKINYLSFTGYARYMYDAFSLKQGVPTHSNSFEAGGKMSLTIEDFNIGIEAIHRNYQLADDLKSQRVVGVINYRISKNFYINGAFGNDFGMGKPKILAMLGTTFGLSREALPF